MQKKREMKKKKWKREDQGLPRLLSTTAKSPDACRRIACWPSIAASGPRCCEIKVETDLEAMIDVIEELLVPPEPSARATSSAVAPATPCSRLILPSLEREVRRELTDRAEAHAVDVFARNLRKLLLQPPVRDRRVLAVDPGFKSGCKMAALDEFGNLLDHGVVHLVGKRRAPRRGQGQSARD